MEKVLSVKQQQDALSRLFQEVTILAMRDYLKAKKPEEKQKIIQDLKSDFLMKQTNGLSKEAAKLLERDPGTAKANLDKLFRSEKQ